MKINLTEILDRHLYVARVETDGPVDEREAILKAMKEVAEKTLDLASEVKYQSSSPHKWLVELTPEAKNEILKIKGKL